MENRIIIEDMNYIFGKLEDKSALQGSTILITGCSGFLGYYFLQFLSRFAEELDIKVIGLDNFICGRPPWLEAFENHPGISIFHFDIVKDDLTAVKGAGDADFILHMASIASPTFYRMYPIETVDANVWGLRKLLDFYREKDIRGLLFFSSSEIYGDPPPEFIPTHEDYRGNVASMGPRACYDEAKRFGETLCYLFAQKYDLPIVIVRPFNNYGPGMRLDDRRVPADFAKAVFENRDIVIYSDGTPKRTYCYVADAITGYLKALLYGKFDYFNIGIDAPEISVSELADIYVKKGGEIMSYQGAVRFEKSEEKDYLTHNPSRRCPKIDKAGRLLAYDPSIKVNEGVGRFLEFIKSTRGEI